MTRRMCARGHCAPCRACHTVLLLSCCTLLALVESRAVANPALVAAFNASGLPLLPGAAGWPQRIPRKLRHDQPGVGSSNVEATLSTAYHHNSPSAASSNKNLISLTELNSTASGSAASNSCSLC